MRARRVPAFANLLPNVEHEVVRAHLAMRNGAEVMRQRRRALRNGDLRRHRDCAFDGIAAARSEREQAEPGQGAAGGEHAGRHSTPAAAGNSTIEAAFA